jgi:hypothetical protein
MDLVQHDSLIETTHRINDAFYAKTKLSSADRAAAAKFIVARQGLPGSYSGAFAGFDDEVSAIRLYTGERIASASARHILGEECCRALRLLDSPAGSAALDRAEAGLFDALNRAADNAFGNNIGLFCCGKCTVGLWRNLLAGGFNRREERLANGVRHLKKQRDDIGGWTRFPFWYTVLALAEIDLPEAKAELKHVRAKIERAAEKQTTRDEYARRRVELARRCIARF